MPSRKIIFILLAVFSIWTLVVRLSDHAPNMTPVSALALFSGMYISGRWRYVVPLIVLFLSDVVLGLYNPFVMVSVYGSFLFVVWIGRALKKSQMPLKALYGSTAASVIFFLVTNFSVWAATPMYAKTVDGLLLAYTLALPFYRNMLIGDFVYITVFLGATAVSLQYFFIPYLKFKIPNSEI